MAILFTGIQVLDCPYPGEVLIQDNRIVAISRDGNSLPRDAVQIVDGGGTATLMPGLTRIIHGSQGKSFVGLTLRFRRPFMLGERFW